MTRPGVGAAASTHISGALVALGLWVGACAGAPDSGDAAPGAGAVAGSGPGAALTQQLRGLNQGLETDINGVADLFEPLPSRVGDLDKLPADVQRADLDPDILRPGLQACFTAPGQGPCNTPQVTRLLDWAQSMGPQIQQMVEDKVAHLSFLRTALEIIIERAPGLVHRTAEARVQVQRIIADGYDTVEATEVNPLEAARIKDAARASFAALLHEKEAFEKLSGRVENEVRPLADQALMLHQQVIASLQRFGDAP